jgi:hypothetical protein
MIINCYDANLNLVGVVEDFIGLKFKRHFTRIGDFEIRLDGNNRSEVGILANSTYIKLRDYECGYITGMTETKAEEDYTYTFTGQELKGLAAKRIVVPPSGEETWKIADRSPEYIMYRLINDHLLNPQNTNRKIDGTFAAYTESADTIIYETKYTKLDDELIKLAEAHQIGWVANIEHGAIVWHLIHGVDRTLGQHNNEPLLLGFEFDMLQSLNYSINTKPTDNMAYVLGYGEGANRPQVMVGDTHTGISRQEVYVDARNSEDDALEEYGKEQIASYGDDVIVNVKPIYEARKYYKQIYDVGDYGTLIEQSLNLQLTECCAIWENNEYKLEFVFGYNGRNLAGALKRYTANFITVLQQDPIIRS